MSTCVFSTYLNFRSYFLYSLDVWNSQWLIPDGGVLLFLSGDHLVHSRLLKWALRNFQGNISQTYMVVFVVVFLFCFFHGRLLTKLKFNHLMSIFSIVQQFIL